MQLIFNLKFYFTGNKYGNRLLYVGVAVNTTLNPSTLGYENGLPIYENWEKFVNDEVYVWRYYCKYD